MLGPAFGDLVIAPPAEYDFITAERTTDGVIRDVVVVVVVTVDVSVEATGTLGPARFSITAVVSRRASPSLSPESVCVP